MRDEEKRLVARSQGLVQDSHVVKLLGCGVGADHSCLPSLDAALSRAGHGGGRWGSSAFLSQAAQPDGF